MQNDDLKTLDYFLCVPNHDFWCLDPIWTQFPQNRANAPNTPKQVKTWPTDGFYIWEMATLM